MHCLAYTCISGTWNRITLTSFSSFSQTKQYENQLNLRAYCEDCKRNFKWPTMPDLQRYPLSTMNNTWSTMYNTRSKCTIHEVQCTIQEVQCTIHEVQCTIHEVHCTIHEVQCTIQEVKFTKFTYTQLYNVHVLSIKKAQLWTGRSKSKKGRFPQNWKVSPQIFNNT